MDIEETVRRILGQFQVIAYQLPQLVIQVDGKQVGVFLMDGKKYKIDAERRQKLIQKIQNEINIPIDQELISSLIDNLEKEFYLNRMEKIIQKDYNSPPINVFFVWKGHLNNEQRVRLYLATQLWYRLEIKSDFINLDDGVLKDLTD
jgi:hypothetical protein